MIDYSKITLGELLSSANETIKRNAISILKQYQKKQNCIECQKPLPDDTTGYCYECCEKIK